MVKESDLGRELVDDWMTAAKVRAVAAVRDRGVDLRFMEKAGLKALVTVCGYENAADAIGTKGKVLLGQHGGYYLIGILKDEGKGNKGKF